MGLEDLQHNFLTGRVEDLVKWARRNSVWPATFGLVEVLVFSVVVVVFLIYLVSNGAFSWGPAKRLREGMPARTSESTIARVTAAPPPPSRAA